jgi:hypothetical protein
LAGLDAEKLSDLCAPLIGQCVPINEDERGYGVGDDEAARDDGLAGTGRSDEHTEVVTGEASRAACCSGSSSAWKVKSLGCPGELSSMISSRLPAWVTS